MRLACGKAGPDFKKIHSQSVYTYALGYGWKTSEGLGYAGHESPDSLRRDSVGSTSANIINVHLRKGSYRMVIVSGDAMEPSRTRIRLSNGVCWDSGPDASLESHLMVFAAERARRKGSVESI